MSSGVHINAIAVYTNIRVGINRVMHVHVHSIIPVALILTCLVGYNVYTVYSLKKGGHDKRWYKPNVNSTSWNISRGAEGAEQGALSSVCVLIPVSSRGQTWGHVEDSFAVQISLQSARNTSEDLLYNYTFYVGYDRGDAFFDNASTVADLRRWFGDNLGQMNLKTVEVLNPHKKPGPVMNALSLEAYSDGCEFMYRINDDTEFLTPWTSAFVRALASFEPPYRGVVGPTCLEGNTAILTHDFVHRGHLDLFGTHYPPELTDWWLDDWISTVYGPKSTLKLADVVVRHHVLSTRYDVTWDNKGLLAEALRLGRLKVESLDNVTR